MRACLLLQPITAAAALLAGLLSALQMAECLLLQALTSSEAMAMCKREVQVCLLLLFVQRIDACL